VGQLVHLPPAFYLVFSLVVTGLFLASVVLVIWRIVDVLLNLHALDGHEARARLGGSTSERWRRSRVYNRASLSEALIVLVLVVVLYVLGLVGNGHAIEVTVLSLIRNLALGVFLALLAVVNALALWKGRVLSRIG
jgi:hypothetical protein